MNKAKLFGQLIEAGLWNDRAQTEMAWGREHPQGKERPSVTDAGKCPKAVWASLNKIEETNSLTTDSLANFLIGKEVEYAYTKVLSGLGSEVLREVKVEIPVGGILVGGKIDLLLKLSAFRCLVEFKSTSRRAMDFMIGRKEWGKDDHRKQTNLYLHAGHLGLLEESGIGADDCESGVLVYVVKDAAKGQRTFYPFNVNYNPIQAERDLFELERIARADAAPPRPVGFKRDKFPCSYCPFADWCWEGK